MTSDFEGFSIPEFIHILILEKETVFPFLLNKGTTWNHFYNVFGMTRSLTGDWTWDLPHSMTTLTTRLSRRCCDYNFEIKWSTFKRDNYLALLLYISSAIQVHIVCKVDVSFVATFKMWKIFTVNFRIIAFCVGL